ncbi:hypothetical protein BUQ74_13190 [Leptospira weilii serovar Heyan]|nr:hypothetical protein BUQ74_13190 [Leptospira weilii serovar Heyan]
MFCPKSDNEFAIFLAPIILITANQIINKQKDLKFETPWCQTHADSIGYEFGYKPNSYFWSLRFVQFDVQIEILSQKTIFFGFNIATINLIFFIVK